MIDFVPVDKDNISNYSRFERDFYEDLQYYQSRIYPYNSDFFAVLKDKKCLAWDYIFYGGKMIGAIWLEKDHPSLQSAHLGIFIADKEERSKGIGQRAIEEYIDMHRADMSFAQVSINVRKESIRAINCFKKCGFSIEKEFEKADGVKVYLMRKDLRERKTDKLPDTQP